ncbi:MAG: winged helix-turn-helix transcriptional regulator [Candidatus Methanoperedenaceae archaeon]|nr:winged helix-turn-helix transcriptional regulator [Candidatus Methanoperedenaceae archaeon]
MRWIGVLLFFLFIFSFTVHAEKGGYTVEPYAPQKELIDTTGADATISFWELPLWIKIAYISGIILASLGLFKVIPIVLARIKNLLENQNRQGIFKYILNNPGCTIAEISDKQEINRGSVKYHIYTLDEGKIIVTKIGKFLRLFQNSGAFKDNEQKMAAHLKSETNRLILRTILENPGTTNQELTDKFHVDKSTIHWHIQQFRNDNIVVFEQEGKYKRYFVNTDAKMILLRFMPPTQSIHAQV